MKIALIAVSLLLTGLSYGQKSISKKVKSRFLSIPNYDMNSTDPAGLQTSYTMGMSEFGSEKLRDGKTICKPKGGSVKDAFEITTYYYEIDVNRQEAYLISKDAQGAVMYAQKVAETKAEKTQFGKDKCQYHIADKMKKEYLSKRSSWTGKNHSTYSDAIYKKAEEIAKNNLVIGYRNQNFEVYSAKGKADYSKLIKAAADATKVYAGFAKLPFSAASLAKLDGPIEVWKAELAKANYDDKSARINKKIAQGIAVNLAYAYMYQFKMDEAVKVLDEADKSFGNFTNNMRTEMKDLALRIRLKKIALAKNNQDLIKDYTQLNKLVNDYKKVKIVVTKNPSSEFTAAKSDFYKFAGGRAGALGQDIKADNDAEEAKNGVDYTKYVIKDVQGKKLTIMALQREMVSIPDEICAIEGLQVININKNKVSMISPEIGSMDALKIINLNYNSLESIPAEIGNCSSLEKLSLNGNPITKLPEEIKNCKKLKSLNLKETKIAADHKAELAKWLPNCKIKY